MIKLLFLFNIKTECIKKCVTLKRHKIPFNNLCNVNTSIFKIFLNPLFCNTAKYFCFLTP